MHGWTFYLLMFRRQYDRADQVSRESFSDVVDEVRLAVVRSA